MTMLVSSIIYLFYSPLIVALMYLAVKIFRVSIAIDANGISSHVSGKMVKLRWEDIEHSRYGYIEIAGTFKYTRYFVLFEVADRDARIRYNRLMTGAERKGNPEITPVKVFQKKAFSFESYGPYLGGDDCKRLTNFIRDYTGKEPERGSGFFSNGDTPD